MINEINKNQIFLSENGSKLFFSVAVISSVVLTILWVGNFSTMDSFVSLSLLSIETMAILGFCIQIFCQQNKNNQKTTTVLVHNEKSPELTNGSIQKVPIFSGTIPRLNPGSNDGSSPVLSHAPKIQSITIETIQPIALPVISESSKADRENLIPKKDLGVPIELEPLMVQGASTIYRINDVIDYQNVTTQWRHACAETPDLNLIQVKFLGPEDLGDDFYELHFWLDYECLTATLFWCSPKILLLLNCFTMRLGAGADLQSKLATRADVLATEINKQTEWSFNLQIPLSIEDWIQRDVFPDISKRSKEGLIIGEMSHSLSSSKKFIIEKMEYFKNLGVKIIFLEHFDIETVQPWFDSYHKTGILPLPLKMRIRTLDAVLGLGCKRYTFLALIQAAQAAGMQIRCMETAVSRAFKSRMQHRLSDMNYIATRIMEHETQRWVAFMGAFHASDCISKNFGTSVGMRQLLKQPTVVIDSGPLDKVSFNERVYRAKNDPRDPQNPGEAQIGPIDALMIIKEPEIASSSEAIQ